MNLCLNVVTIFILVYIGHYIAATQKVKEAIKCTGYELEMSRSTLSSKNVNAG